MPHLLNTEGDRPEFNTLTAGQDLTAYDLVAVNDNMRVTKAQAKTNSNSYRPGVTDFGVPALGIIEGEALSGSPVMVRTTGLVYNPEWDWPEGAMLYISPNPGDLTSGATASYTQPVALALTDKAIYLNPGLMAHIHVQQDDSNVLAHAHTLNFVEGSGVNLSITFNPLKAQADITISTSGGGDGHAHLVNRDVTPAPDGAQALFTVSGSQYDIDTLEVYVNGVHQNVGSGLDFVETTPSAGTFTFQPAAIPDPGDKIVVNFEVTT